MLLDRIDKEPDDVTRIVADMSWWLDQNEHITAIVSQEIIQGMAGWSEAPYPPRDTPPPYDPTPLVMLSATLDDTSRQLITFVEFGTSGVAYTVRFVLAGTPPRQIAIELGVQVTGVPPEEPLPVPVPIPPMPQGALALSITGGTMQGPLYLFEDPKYPTEAATKEYVDGMSWAGGPFMPTFGGTFTGAVTMSSTLTLEPSDPLDPLSATSKQYVDGRIASAGVGVIVSATPPNVHQGFLWFDSVNVQLFVGYDDGSSVQWVLANNVDIDLGGGGGGGITAGVNTFNARSGDVVLTFGDVNSALGYTAYDAANPAFYQTAAQVSASIAAAAYTLPTASTSVIGGVRVDGSTVTISGLGVISAAPSYTLPAASTTVRGGVRVDGTTITVAGDVISAAGAGVTTGAGLGTVAGALVSRAATTLTATATAAVPAPPSGTTTCVIAMGSVNTTLDIGNGAYEMQPMIVRIDQGATPHTVTLGASIVLGADIVGFTASGASKSDLLSFFWHVGKAKWLLAAVQHGY